MKSRLRLTVLTIGCLFLCACTFFACNTKNDLQLVSKNFEDEIEQQQNLVFLFNRDLCPDSLLNAWDSTQYIEFTPAVKGMFKWNSASELAFSPADGFEPGTEYTATLTRLLNKHSKRKHSVSSDPIRFHTAPLRITASHLSWTRGKNAANVMVQLDMSFNYEVNLAEAATRLKLSSKGTPITVASAGAGNGKVLSVQFGALNDRDEETPLKIELARGIPIVGAKNTSAKDTTFNDVIPSRYNLSITGITAQHTGSEGVITVSTSQPVLDDNLKSMVALQPNSPVEVTLNDGGFTITGKELSVSQAYQLTISSKLEGAFGGKMKSDYSEQVTFGKLEPSITFLNNKGLYISSAGLKNLALNIVNVPNVEVTVTKVYENNLEEFMRHGTDDSYGSDDDGDGRSFEHYQTDNYGDVIYKKKYETSKLPKQNAARILHLDFEDKIRDYNGIYVLTVASADHYYLQQSRILCVSDIGLIVKKEDDNIYVFANSIKTTNPLQDVKVSFISTNNQKLTTLTTDNDGVAIFKDISKAAPGFSVGMITAQLNSDYSMLMFRNTGIGTSRFDVGGRRPNSAGLITMIYPERNLYRPGETIHVSAVVRDEQWKPQPEIPVKVRLNMPNGKELATQRKTLNEEGSCDVSFTPPPTAMTGTYTVEVYSGNDVLLNSYDISVEEFVPDRMKVSLKLDRTEYDDTSAPVVATIQADNLFGTPAAGRNYECQMNLTKETFESDKFSDYSFYINNDITVEPDLRNESKTDEKGAATEEFDLGSGLAGGGMFRGRMSATVFDETGRPVHRYASFVVYTQPVFVGIKCDDNFVPAHQPVRIGLVAVDKNSVPRTTEVEVEVLQKYWHSVIEQNGSSYRYVSRAEQRVISQQKMTLRGNNTDFIVTPKESGDYEVRVFINGSNDYVAHSMWAYGWGETESTSFEVDNEGNVDIKPDKKDYNVGDKVNILFTAPFDGKLLVTLERDHVLKYYYLTTKNKTASLSFDANDAHIPNVYVAATLFRPMDASDLPLTVAHGYKPITVSDKGNKLPVEVTAIDKSRSKTTQTISVKTAPGAYVTVAAVDEGILQVKNFETPDPYEFFYQKMALSVNSYDIYPWLLPEVKATLSSTGGDGADKSAMRVNPTFVNRIKNVSFWSGILQADGSGNVKYNIDIPQFSGDLRIMAVAYKGKAFGSADRHMKVADPIVISAALPRFLSPRDQVVMPVTVTNTTAKAASATVTVKVTGPMDIAGSSTQTVEIPANREQRVVFNVDALPQIGGGKVTVTVKAMGESFVNETEIGVRPPASLQKLTGSGFAAGDASTPLDLKNSFIPTSVSGRLVVDKSPLTEFSKHLEDLVHYPYGCVEQTTSTAFPQLYYADLVKAMGGSGTDKDINPAYYVQQAITKLQSMQLGDGALSYWPEGGSESWWGSAYACNFLIEAKKAGYQVNQGTIDRILEYLKFKLASKETITFFYNGTLRKEVAPEEVPYSLYVLALAGQSQLGTMNYYKAHQELLTLDSRYLIGAAYYLAGQPKQGRDMMPNAFAGEEANRSFSGSFYSFIRDEALSLNVLLDVDPGNSQIGVMAKQLSEQLRKERYLSTQEEVFSILALGKIARMANKTSATASVTAGGKAIGNTSGSTTINLKPYVNDAVNIQVHGKGGYYYFWEVDGITSDGSYKQEDSYIKVRRTYFDRFGHENTTNTFRQNDLVVVRLSIETLYDGMVDNVAITDMLPAGFEIENTRLTEMPDMDWIKNEADADYRDIRDDRINMFTSVGRARRDFYYMVRAVSPGTYQLGPVQADAMYDGNYHSYNGAGVVKVEQ